MYSEAELIRIQAQIYEQSGMRTDVYYEAGRGVLVVPEGAALTPDNIISVIAERTAFTWTF